MWPGMAHRHSNRSKVKDKGQDSSPPTTQLPVKDAVEDGTQTLQQITGKDKDQDGPLPMTTAPGQGSS